MDQIASFIGCKPNFWKLLVKDPEMALRCYFGPCVPAQFRLQGPNQWKGAREIIRNAISRGNNSSIFTKESNLTHRKSLKTEHSKYMPLLMVLFVFIVWLMKVLLIVY